jgi:hypothetical protein
MYADIVKAARERDALQKIFDDLTEWEKQNKYFIN